MGRTRFSAVVVSVAMVLAWLAACDHTPQAVAAAAVNTPQLIRAAEVVARGDRKVSIDINTASGEDFENSFALTRELGATVTELTVYWDDIERRPGLFTPDPNWLEIANSYYPRHDTQVLLVLAVLDTTRRRLPADLADRALDDPVVIERFQHLLDWVRGQVTDLELVGLAFGNEVDIELSASDDWDPFLAFFQAGAGHARQAFPGVPVGFKSTFAGLTVDHVDQLQALHRHADIVMATYYPLVGFWMRPPAEVGLDLDHLSALYPDHPIVFAETGYASGAGVASSEEQQAAFIRAFFEAWDRHQAQIPIVFFTWLTDIGVDAVRELEAYYGLHDQEFAEFLGTLGLRQQDGTPKTALDVLADELAARGW